MKRARNPLRFSQEKTEEIYSDAEICYICGASFLGCSCGNPESEAGKAIIEAGKLKAAEIRVAIHDYDPTIIDDYFAKQYPPECDCKPNDGCPHVEASDEELVF